MSLKKQIKTLLGRTIIVNKGSYDATASYQILDTVTSNYVTYLAIKNVPANTPVTNSSYWFVLASGKGYDATIDSNQLLYWTRRT